MASGITPAFERCPDVRYQICTNTSNLSDPLTHSALIHTLPSVNARGKGTGDEPKKKTYTKSNLPSKVCESCGRPFDWRKKWEKVWDEVK